MGAFGTMSPTEPRKSARIFYCSHCQSEQHSRGYILSSFIIGFVMSMFTLILAEIYIVAEGGSLMTPTMLVKVIGLILLANFSIPLLSFS